MMFQSSAGLCFDSFYTSRVRHVSVCLLHFENVARDNTYLTCDLIKCCWIHVISGVKSMSFI